MLHTSQSGVMLDAKQETAAFLLGIVAFRREVETTYAY